MSKKLTYEEAKSYIESYGYQLLSTEYKNNSSKLNIKCSEGHIYKASFWIFKSGKRCPICYNKKRGDMQPSKYTHQEVKNSIESFGYTLLSKYKNAHTKIMLQCPEGHTFTMKYNSFEQG